jgi:cytochrome b561
MARQAIGGEYGSAAKLFHWLTVALIIVQFTLGWTMPNIRRGQSPEGLVGLHLSFGTLILGVMVLRLGWRLAAGAPPAPAALPLWQRRAAGLVHGGLYALILGMTLSGWCNASTRGWTIRVFGLFDLPPLTAEGSTIGRAIGRLHGNIAWAVLALISLHVLAALYHALRRDGVMGRMVPWLPSSQP